MNVKIGNILKSNPPIMMGSDYFPCIVANVGVNDNKSDLSYERQKINAAISAGADVIADLSLVSDAYSVHSRLFEGIQTTTSAVAVYEVYLHAKKIGEIVSDMSFIDAFERMAKRGVDIITLHATALLEDAVHIKTSKRLIPCTSRGGAMVLEIINKFGYENPYLTYFNDILSIAKRYNVCLSLGPCYRAGSVFDSLEDDLLFTLELERMEKLVSMAQAKGVGILVEGIGHAAMHRIPLIVSNSIKTCHSAPYRVLTVATDIALGYDHIASAIASSLAVQYGASSITCVSRAEHIGLPTVDEVKEAVISAKIAAYCGYSARTANFTQDKKMSFARQKYGCKGQIEAALYPIGAKEEFKKRHNLDMGYACEMCGDCCPFEILDKLNKGK